jgi:predicted enzyme related to lactoylglutathione lyase
MLVIPTSLLTDLSGVGVAGHIGTGGSVFDSSSDHFAPSTSAFMINYAVDDLDAMVKRLKDKGVTVLKRTDDDAFGRFAWIVDPEGNKVELWEPKR